MIEEHELKVKSLGKALVDSPLKLSSHLGDGLVNYVTEDSKVRYQVDINSPADLENRLLFEKAGPRKKIFFEPSHTKAAVVTCGGLCPGINNVIRSLFLELNYKYRIPEVFGIRYGFKGLNPAHGYYPILLTSKNTDGIQNRGGSFLGSSRGGEDVKTIADTIEDIGVDILVCIGGDGTLKGAHAIHNELESRNRKISVIAVPKTIDNDISFVYKTFGFDTAVEVATRAIRCAHVEAIGTPNGIGLVKVMGRDSGFIAAHSTLASLEVNFCLIPEVGFELSGKNGLLELLENRLSRRSHAVIVVAEGAAKNIYSKDVGGRDPSGNIVLKDVGDFLKYKIKEYFNEKEIPFDLKYIDPSYIIRSVPANAVDSIFCENLARNAAHAGMSGKTDVMIGLWHGSYTHVPLDLVTRQRKYISPESSLWRDVLGATGQPAAMGAEDIVNA